MIKTMTKSTGPALLMLTSCTLASGIAGCTAASNSRASIGAGEDAVYLSAFTSETEPAAWSDAPSVEGLSRENWAGRTIVVPNDGVQFQPHLTTTHHNGQADAFPTIEEALAPESYARQPLAQILMWPFAIGRDVVLALPRVCDGNGSGPDGPEYQRVPTSETQGRDQ